LLVCGSLSQLCTTEWLMICVFYLQVGQLGRSCYFPSLYDTVFHCKHKVTNKLFLELQVGHITARGFCIRKYFMTTKETKISE
jgi:hypothetical protein